MKLFRTFSNRRLLTGVSLTAVVAVVVPLTVTATTASWPDQEWVHADAVVETSSLRCGTDTGFTAAASGDFLSGQLLGIDLDQVAELAPQELAVAPDGRLAVDPGDATDRGSTAPTYTYTDPLALSVLGDAVTLDLTGLAVGLPVGSTGAVTQYAQVSGFGTATGASGLVSDSGGLLVDDTAPDGRLPGRATISLDALLPDVTGVVADPRVEVGAVGASSRLDGCGMLRSMLWGEPAVSTPARSYGIAGLDLALESALLEAVLTDVGTAVTTIDTAVDALVGPNGAVARLIGADLTTALGSLGLGSLVSTAGTQGVWISGLNVQGAVGRLLAPLDDEVISLDLGEGLVEVDLAALLSDGPAGLNNLEPNTELLLNAAVVNNIVERVTALLGTRIQQVVSILETAILDATLNVSLNAAVNLGALRVAGLGVGLTASLRSLIAVPSTAALAITLTVLPDLPLGIGPLLNGLLGGVTSALNGLTTGLVAPIANLLTTTVFGVVDQLDETLADVLSGVVDALAVVLAPLPRVLSVMVNVQPDQPGAPVGSTFHAATDTSTASYSVSALRLGVGDGAGGLAFVELATATAGPITAP